MILYNLNMSFIYQIVKLTLKYMFYAYKFPYKLEAPITIGLIERMLYLYDDC